MPSPLTQVSNSRDSTASAADDDVVDPKVSIRASYKRGAKGSISNQALIWSSSDAETVTADPADTDVGYDLQRSESQDSILTALCNGVTQPYSPLSEQRIDSSIMTTVSDAPSVQLGLSRPCLFPCRRCHYRLAC